MSMNTLCKTVLDETARFRRNCNGQTCPKFNGSLVCELFRRFLISSGFAVSAKDVFIEGVPIEVDLLVLRPGSRAKYGLLYESRDVIAALEIKHRGVIGEQGQRRLRQNFDRIKLANKKIACIYISLRDTETYKWRPTMSNMKPHKAYTCCYHDGPEPKTNFRDSKEVEKLIRYLRCLS